VAEAVIPREVCAKLLRTTPEKMAEINLKKNLIGTMLAGGLRSANAHFANMLLAFYLATGQDAANLVEGSQGFVHAEVNPDGHLYFSCTLPHLIVGTIGNGKDLDFVRDNLDALGCRAERPPGRQRAPPGRPVRRHRVVRRNLPAGRPDQPRRIDAGPPGAGEKEVISDQ
jgi:hydroxymethylglutaryl-CoA reductase (NADPH)